MNARNHKEKERQRKRVSEREDTKNIARGLLTVLQLAGQSVVIINSLLVEFFVASFGFKLFNVAYAQYSTCLRF